MDIKEEYRKEFRCIKKEDKIVPYRSPRDMRYGSLKIEEHENHFLILGQNKNNGGNLIKFAKVYNAEPNWEAMGAQILMCAGILMSVLTGFSTFMHIIH